MNFNQKLYEKTCLAIPGITVRQFSQYLGKSEGYWNSMQAQKLPVTTNSLLFLAARLELRQNVAPSSLLSDLIRFIADEIGRRIIDIKTENIVIRRMILKSVAYAVHDRTYNAPPVIIG